MREAYWAALGIFQEGFLGWKLRTIGKEMKTKLRRLRKWRLSSKIQQYFPKASPDHISLLNFHNCHPYIYSIPIEARISHSLFPFLLPVLQPALFSVTQGAIKHKMCVCARTKGGKSKAQTKGIRFKPLVLPYNLQNKRKICKRKH